MKTYRQDRILGIISEQCVDTQEKLRELLLAENISVTQATLSRDIRELHLRKAADVNGNIRYIAEKREKVSVPQIFRDSVISIDFAGNTVVFRCNTGMAQAACAVFDRLGCSGVVGTLAGDDTIFVLMRTPEDASALADEMSGLLASPPEESEIERTTI